MIEEAGGAITPPGAFGIFKDDRYAYFLDSGMDPERYGRYSFIGSDPFLVLKTRGNRITLTEEGKTREYRGDPLTATQEILDRYRTESVSQTLPFGGGAVGYLSYDLGRSIEKLPEKARDDLDLPEIIMGFYDSGVVFDNREHKAYVTSTGLPKPAGPERQRRARERLKELKSRLAAQKPARTASGATASRILAGEIRSNFSREGYLKAVAKARQYIIDGDIFEVNLSQRFEAEIGSSAFELYEQLRAINPAPFAAYLNFDEVQIVSASPERFLKKTGGKIETRPIKGTRRRGKTPEEDTRLARELTESAKDRAENIMIVDLERNDLGRVCRYGTVKVRELTALERFPTVFHLTSTVEGQLREGQTIRDVLRATFPGGSITGAPKVRAMEIIEELEPTRRSIYTGSIGYIGFNGDLDLNIAIRTFIVKQNRVYFQAGGAVVYDSDPEDEYQETLDKARALFEALLKPAMQS